LQDANSGIQIAFMYGGTSDGEHAPGLLSLGVIYNGSWWNRVGDFWLESAKKAGIAGGFCILKAAIFGMNFGWHEHRNAAGGYGIRIRSQAFARSRRCAEFSVIRRRA
jgi:hypothetical protein